MGCFKKLAASCKCHDKNGARFNQPQGALGVPTRTPRELVPSIPRPLVTSSRSHPGHLRRKAPSLDPP